MSDPLTAAAAPEVATHSVHEHEFRAALWRIDALAADIGRLRRRLGPDSPVCHLADRLATHVESLDLLLHPSAGVLTRDSFLVAGDWGLAAEEAVLVVDDRAVQLRRLLGEEWR